MLDGLKSLSPSKRPLIERLVGQLGSVTNLVAIVLGGSYASGTQHASSDVDLGLYYFEASPFAIAEIQRIAKAVSVQPSLTVTGFYEWGAWVNGGAWIKTQEGKVDLLYRNLDQVQRTIIEAQQGLWQHDYDQQPTYGYYSVTYLAETHICIPLYDPTGQIAKLKRLVAVYPPLLKQAVIADSLWAAEFGLLHAQGFAVSGDVYNTVGCLTRVAANITQALFAINESYYIRDKGVMNTLARLPKLPLGYVQQIIQLLACPGSTPQELTKTVAALEQAWHSVVSLTGGEYRPKFRL